MERRAQQIRDYAVTGRKLLWQRQMIFFAAAVLTAIYYDPVLSLLCYAVIQATEVNDSLLARRIIRARSQTPAQTARFRKELIVAAGLSSVAIGLYAAMVARMEGPGQHFMPLFFLFAAALFAAINNHQILAILRLRLAIYTVTFLYIPVYDLWTVQPGLSSPLWLQFFTIVFVLYFVYDCSAVFMRLYRRNLDQVEVLRLKHQQAEAASQAKSRFIATVSHELRTPLTSIKGALDLMEAGNRSGVQPGSSNKQLLRIASTNAARLGALISDLLDFQKFEAGKLALATEALDVVPLVEEAIEEIGPHSEKEGVTLRLTSSEPSLHVFGDRQRLKQVAANLFSNAIKFSERGSEVRVELSRRGPTLEMRVTDSGTGIPEGAEDKVFEAFRQVDNSDTRKAGGTGIGLSISRHIVRLHDGEITYSSTLGEGTTFLVTLPVHEAGDTGDAEPPLRAAG